MREVFTGRNFLWSSAGKARGQALFSLNAAQKTVQSAISVAESVRTPASPKPVSDRCLSPELRVAPRERVQLLVRPESTVQQVIARPDGASS